MSYTTCQAAVLTILKTIPAFQDTYTADSISFDAATHKVLDSANALAWIPAGTTITVTGSASNDNSYTVTSSAAGFVIVTEALINEAEGATITITRPATAVIGDYRPLDRGYKEIAVLNPGAFTDQTDGWAQTDPSPLRWWTWDVIVELFERYTPDEPTATAAFTTLRDAVTTALVKAPNLDGSTLRVQLISIASEGDPVDRGASETSPFFKSQILRLRVKELDSNTAGNT